MTFDAEEIEGLDLPRIQGLCWERGYALMSDGSVLPVVGYTTREHVPCCMSEADLVHAGPILTSAGRIVIWREIEDLAEMGVQ